MARAKKTVRVQVLFDRYAIALSKVVEREETDACSALSFVIESLLLEADAYAGFEYVNRDGSRVPSEQVRAGNYTNHLRRYFPPKV